MRAGYTGIQLGGGPWCGYWYGVILQVVEGAVGLKLAPETQSR